MLYGGLQFYIKQNIFILNAVYIRNYFYFSFIIIIIIIITINAIIIITIIVAISIFLIAYNRLIISVY